ncbi:zinc ABC transporter ATP-binding protein ZnuC [Sansalvadorimonas sp. 2012CJ34-2]|uniref:Zinc ABC transporter ATP-binding protein ZnuC n=1 Tax=Parendozoicomonas callyspongiae TaxID=2942213 RepID=A0ABT0PAR4_9GAMM|nr:zinc ABC transporter ATP-binding protein ZnuC [Sansalvadorimonas sp. 2012CJ34-2]MCL6268479.1 zinc ABC transporter ATP-binding protein ZnuC [Sansalvadorimonas sp. 2012CJ34-2]
MSEPLLELKDVRVGFHGRTVLQNIDLHLNSGEIVTLIGPNGAGKTTLVRIVLGLLKPDSGHCHMMKDLRIGYMPQKLQIEPSMPLPVSRFLSLAGASKKQILNALTCTGVEHIYNSPIQTLSGGETQRVLLARALLRKPQLLILDEPVQGVDVNGQRELYHLIKIFRDETGCGVLMVSHDLHLVMAATDKVICLNNHICCSGHPSQVSQHPAYLQLFGHESSELAIYTHNHNHAIDGHVIDCGDCQSGNQDKSQQ